MTTSCVSFFIILCFIICNIFLITYAKLPYKILNILLMVFIDKNFRNLLKNIYKYIIKFIIINMRLILLVWIIQLYLLFNDKYSK